jgi:hypothetical protein
MVYIINFIQRLIFFVQQCTFQNSFYPALQNYIDALIGGILKDIGKSSCLAMGMIRSCVLLKALEQYATYKKNVPFTFLRFLWKERS